MTLLYTHPCTRLYSSTMLTSSWRRRATNRSYDTSSRWATTWCWVITFLRASLGCGGASRLFLHPYKNTVCYTVLFITIKQCST